MNKRADLYNRSSLDTLLENSPFLLLFAKQGWREYLELIAKIYDLIEESGSRAEYDRVRGLIDLHYAGGDYGAIDQKRFEFISMAITQLGVLRDTHDAGGRRFIEATQEGRSLLKLCEELLLNRRKFVGTGADTLLGAVNRLMSVGETVNLEGAIADHRRKIKAYQEDIDRMKQHGVQASELLSIGVSPEELFTQAEDAASYILSAGEDIKASIERARRELVSRYRDKAFSAGQAIEYVADFYESLWTTSEFSSFGRAKDLFSHIEGLGVEAAARDGAIFGCFRVATAEFEGTSIFAARELA